MSFEPYSVECLTCGSRLRVTDPSLVGTIASCPKCESMVQIDPPAHQVAVGGSSVDTQAITEDAISSPETDSDANQVETSGGFVGGEATSEDTTGAAPIPPQWQSSRSQRSRQIALVAAVSISGLLAAVLLFSWFVRNWRSNDNVAQQDPAAEVDTDPAQQQATVDADPPGDSEQQVDANTERQTSEANPNRAEPNQANTEDVESVVENEKPAQQPRVDEPTPPPPPGGSLTESPLVQPVAIAPVAIAPAEEKGGDEPEMMMKIPDGLAEFGDVLAPFGPVDLRPTEKAPPTLDELNLEAAATEQIDPDLALNPPRKINPVADFSIPIAFDDGNYRLTELALILSQVSDVPVQIDLVSFDLAGIDAHRYFKTKRTELTPAMKLLEQIGQAIGAEVQIREQLLVLTPSDATFDAKLAEVIELDDFGAGSDSAVLLLNEFVSDQPNDGGTLQVGDTREEKQFLILATESLRRMRGVAPKVSDPLFAHWGQTKEDRPITWEQLSGGDPIAQPITPISIAGLVRRTAKQNQASVVIQWTDAVRRRLSPAHTLIPHAGDDAAKMFDRVFSPFDLQVRKIDEDRWWIGAPATYDRAPIVVWTKPLAEGGKMFEQRVRSVIGAQDAFRYAFDQESGRALMLLPRYLAGQLPKIEASLAAAN